MKETKRVIGWLMVVVVVLSAGCAGMGGAAGAGEGAEATAPVEGLPVVARTADTVIAEGVIEDYRDYRLSEGKAKGPNCKSCRFDSECEGPWREYSDRYGWAEFLPRKP